MSENIEEELPMRGHPTNPKPISSGIEAEMIEEEMDIQAPLKPKKVLTEAQRQKGRENLAKGREKLAEIKKQQREENEKKKNELVLIKAEKIKKQETKMIKDIGLNEDDIKHPTTSGVVKRKVVYREVDLSEDEEEVVLERKKIVKPKPAKMEEPKKPKQPIVLFYG